MYEYVQCIVLIKHVILVMVVKQVLCWQLYRLRDSGSGLVLSMATLWPCCRALSQADTQFCQEPSVSLATANKYKKKTVKNRFQFFFQVVGVLCILQHYL